MAQKTIILTIALFMLIVVGMLVYAKLRTYELHSFNGLFGLSFINV